VFPWFDIGQGLTPDSSFKSVLNITAYLENMVITVAYLCVNHFNPQGAGKWY